MNNFFEENNYFFNNIYPYLSIEEQKECIKELGLEEEIAELAKEERKQLFQILNTNNVVDSINNNIDILLDIIPEINDMVGFEHKHPHHHLDVWNHTLLSLYLSENDFDTRLCLLLHDIGKPHSYQEGEIRHFKGHAKKSSEISRNILTRLNFDEKYINEMCYLIENHDKLITEEDIKNNRDITLKRYIIQYCDAFAHNPSKLTKRIKYLKDTLKIIKEYEPNIENKIKIKM